MLSILLAALVMVARDASVEFLTIAQTRGNAKLAALLGPASTLTGLAVTAVGIGPVLENHGHVTLHAVAVIGVLLIMDVLDGYVFTRLGRRIKVEA